MKRFLINLKSDILVLYYDIRILYLRVRMKIRLKYYYRQYKKSASRYEKLFIITGSEFYKNMSDRSYDRFLECLSEYYDYGVFR